MSATRILVALSVLAYAGIGVWVLVDPVTPMADVGVAAVDARGLVELRAMYGGLQLGMAGFLAWCAASEERARTGLVAATTTIGGLGAVRLLSWLALQPEGWVLPLLCVVELGGAAIGLAVLITASREAS